MKHSIILLAIAGLLFAGCTNNKSDEHSNESQDAHEHTEGTHVHEDGSVHKDHQNSEHSQEEFKVESDSTAIEIEEHDHSHEDGSHQH